MALLCVFYIFDVQVFYITSMIAAILVGMAGDNAIQFLFFSQGSKNLNSGVTNMAPASLLIAVGMVLACSVFFFGYFAPMQTLGLMMIVGIILSFIGDVWILRGLSSS